MKILTACEICKKERYIKPGRIGKHSFCRGKCQKEFLKLNPGYYHKNRVFKNGWVKGKPRSEETKQKIREKLSGKPTQLTEKGRKSKSDKMKKNQFYKLVKNRPKGDKHYNWKGGTRSEKKIIYDSAEYKQWRKAVFERDNYTCQHCFKRNGNGEIIYLEADHIKPFALYPEFRFDINNGRTLCKPCHIKTPTYSRRIKSKEDYEKLINK